MATEEGNVIKSTISDNKESSQNYADIIADIVEKARMALKDKESTSDELTFLKIRTKRLEFIVVPGKLLIQGAYLPITIMTKLYLILIKSRDSYNLVTIGESYPSYDDSNIIFYLFSDKEYMLITMLNPTLESTA